MVIDKRKCIDWITILYRLKDNVFDSMSNAEWEEYLKSRVGYRNSTGIGVK